MQDEKTGARKGGRGRTAGKWLGGLGLLLVVALAAAWWATLPDEPGAFYTPPPTPPAEPGILLRSEAYDTDIPAGAKGWRILYTSRLEDGSPTVASAIVVLPDIPAQGPRPVIAWAHGTTGIAPGCAPSTSPAPFGGTPGMDEVVERGWAMVATDYAGMGAPGHHAYLVGQVAAYSVLDSVNAARQMADWQLGDRVVVWGHSQGGHAALWTGIRAGADAPELEIAGVAAMAPVTELAAMLGKGASSAFGEIISAYLYTAYHRLYPDVGDAYISRFHAMVAKDISRRCILDWRAAWSLALTRLLPDEGLFLQPISDGPFGDRLAQNDPTGAIAAPLLLAQGLADEVIDPKLQEGFVARRCAAGQPIDYREYPSLTHVSLVGPGSAMTPQLLAWTEDRFAGKPASSTCSQR